MIKYKIKLLSISLIAMLVLPLSANLFASELIIKHPYARATPPHAITSAVFLELENNSEIERTITSAVTPAAGKVELHTHVMEGDVMKMRQIDNIKIPAMAKVALKPGGLHIMLFELQQEFKEGQHIEVSLNFANGETQTFTAKIKKVMAGMKHKH